MPLPQLLIVLLVLFRVLLSASLCLNRYEPALRRTPVRARVHLG